MIININNEKELHYKIIDYIKKYIKEAIIIPGLGEHHYSSTLRSDAYFKGYQGGQPDIIALNYHTKCRGLAIEFKTPTGHGVVSKNQQNYLKQLEHNGFQTLVSDDYDLILTTIVKYSLGIRYLAKATKRKFRSVEARSKYLEHRS